jgi:hypothetical protein
LIPVDTSVHIGYYNYIGSLIQWSSDTSFVFPTSDSSLAEYFIFSKRIDTLVTLHISPFNKIVSFAYNADHNILAYSVYEVGLRPRVFFHYKDSIQDTLAFSLDRDDPTCSSLSLVFTYLNWSPGNDKLGFLGYGAINDMTDLFVYSISSNRTYRVLQCNDSDLKYSLEWGNEDILIFIDNDNFHLYSVDLSKIDAIRNKKDKPFFNDYSIVCYPNPFNNGIKFSITLPSGMDGNLSICDVLGRLIMNNTIANQGRTKYEVEWNGFNNNNTRAASGIYYAILELKNQKINNQKIVKMIYLK